MDGRTRPAHSGRPPPQVASVVAHSMVNYLASRGDERYFLSSGKDQEIRLWDMRKLGSAASSGTGASPSGPDRGLPAWLMSYKGHSVFSTLIHAHFSPSHTTGGRFIVTGSEDGNIYVYDVLSGAVVSVIHGHSGVVRDVAWHPYRPVLYSASWDGTVGVSEPCSPPTARPPSAASEALLDGRSALA